MNLRIKATVYAGRSSINQWPEPATTSSWTLFATWRMMTAWSGPKDFSPPTAMTGMVSFACSKTLLSFASWAKAVNCAKPARIPRCKEISGCFVRLPGIAREVVPNAVEIDALASSHQALRVWAMKIEVPHSGILQYLAPWFDSRDGCVHHD